MQANPATDKNKRDLATWLENPSSKPAAVNRPSDIAKQDLTWLTQHTKDLSCVSISDDNDTTTGASTATIGAEKDIVSARVDAVIADDKRHRDLSGVEKRRGTERESGTSTSTSSTGGFLALFTSCASKRKSTTCMI